MAAACVCPQCGANLSKDAPQGLCPSCLLRSGLAAGEGANGTAAHHGPFLPPAVAELARHFPQLEIQELIGVGGMGAVYKARQTKLDRLVALKVLPPGMCKDPAFAERFTREARALARLSHPNIVAVHDFGEVEGVFFFLMEYVDGANLRQILETGRLTPAEALRIVPQVCEALQYAHEEGVVHRDIKPENILLDQKGRVKVADFGLAKLVGTTPGMFTLTGSRQVVGTPHYMAPEQMERPHTVDHRADIYSLGVVLYEMLTGELPLGRFAVPSMKAPVDSRLDEVVLRALAKEPEQRFQRVSELRDSLAEVAARERGGTYVVRPGAALCVPFAQWVEQMGRWIEGMLRLDGQGLVLELQVIEYEKGIKGFFHIEAGRSVKEKEIPLSEIQSIRVESGWFRTALVLQGRRLSVLADVPGSSMGQMKMRIHNQYLADAEELAARVSARLPHGSVVNASPVSPSVAPILAAPRSTPARGFVGRKVHSLVNKARYWMVDSLLYSRASEPDEPPAPGAPAAAPQRGRVRRFLGATVGNSVLWAVLMCLLGTATILMPWSESRSSWYLYTRYEGFPPQPVTVYQTYSGERIHLPKDLSLPQVYRHVPELRSAQKTGFSYEEGMIVAGLFGGLALLLIATSSLSPGNLVRPLFLVPGAIGVMALSFEHISRIGYERSAIANMVRTDGPNRSSYPPPGVTETEWRDLLNRLLAHWTLEPDFGVYVAIGLSVGLLLLGSWQLRSFFSQWQSASQATS